MHTKPTKTIISGKGSLKRRGSGDKGNRTKINKIGCRTPGGWLILILSANEQLLNVGVLAVSGDKKRADLVEQINGEEDDHQGERVASRGNDGSEHE